MRFAIGVLFLCTSCATPNRTVVVSYTPLYPKKKATYDGREIKISDFVICGYTPIWVMDEHIRVHEMPVDSIFSRLIDELASYGLNISVQDTINRCSPTFYLENDFARPRWTFRRVKRIVDIENNNELLMVPTLMYRKTADFPMGPIFMSNTSTMSGGGQWLVKNYVILNILIFDSNKLIYRKQIYIDSVMEKFDDREEARAGRPPGPYVTDEHFVELVRRTIKDYLPKGTVKEKF